MGFVEHQPSVAKVFDRQILNQESGLVGNEEVVKYSKVFVMEA